ncbi:MAG TPA: phosphoenolpyruvate carboxykinase (ATP) [Candidatus Gastranaerophilaceae bacterium]|nr:phosphoenolpyruvate carboxykinase (ATP) [Candidatus Gastranaerophilaceae bacterium]HPT42036.1 phosphoenolpyruvate carboxykinase (ATP) [Candidatus Gastranaerophilaceae bacterium]
MSTIEFFTDSEELKSITSAARATLTAPFFANNIKEIRDLKEAYLLAKNSSGTIELTGMPVYKPEKLGLPSGTNQLLFNDGTVVGRCAAARKIVGEPGCDLAQLLPILREAVYCVRDRLMYKTQVVVGLEEDFMVKAHLLIPEGFENVMYSWMLNFQYITNEYAKMYKNSRKINEGDIFVFSDPDWTHPDFPYGLTFFDPEHNCAAILGMRYFGEHKKGTLTLAWGAAARNGYASCHGGMKRYNLKDKSFQTAVFGLSGSGKSTITHAKHNNKYDITVLHDDAFIINVDKKYSIALEPAYFDKTQDYPMGCEDNKYIITQQNNGAIQGKDGKIYSITEDIRNGNGRAVKSKLWSPNRVDRVDEPINAIFWLMKDSTIPPVIKLSGASLGSAMGATLATKRTSAERLAQGVDPDALVVEPYANPFRVYPLEMDYTRFKQLIEDGVDCYILNTGDFMGKKVKPENTLGIIEAIVEGSAEFKKWGNFSDIQILKVEGFEANFDNAEYKDQFIKRMKDRIEFVKSREVEKAGLDKLPADALEALEKVIAQV